MGTEGRFRTLRQKMATLVASGSRIDNDESMGGVRCPEIPR